MTKTWKTLKPGDIVDSVAPGSASRPEDFQAGLDLIKSWGLVPRLPENLMISHPFFSNENKPRFEFLKKALLAKDSKAIWCLRGGYGGLRIMPDLLKLKAPVAQNKILIGYSDISSLHLWLTQKWKWTSLHAPLVESLGKEKYDISQINELRDVLMGKQKEVKFSLVALNIQGEKLKKIQSSVIGGNLCVLASHSGTKCALNAKGKIVVLEDIGERGYRIDRMLEQLKQSGNLDKATAVVFGDFTGGNEKDGENFTAFAMETFARENKIPCFMGLEIGHGSNNRPVFFGSKATLKGGIDSELIVSAGSK